MHLESVADVRAVLDACIREARGLPAHARGTGAERVRDRTRDRGRSAGLDEVLASASDQLALRIERRLRVVLADETDEVERRDRRRCPRDAARRRDEKADR